MAEDVLFAVAILIFLGGAIWVALKRYDKLSAVKVRNDEER